MWFSDIVTRDLPDLEFAAIRYKLQLVGQRRGFKHGGNLSTVLYLTSQDFNGVPILSVGENETFGPTSW